MLPLLLLFACCCLKLVNCVLRIDVLRREICSSNVDASLTTTPVLELLGGHNAPIELCVTPVGSRNTSRFPFAVLLDLVSSSTDAATTATLLTDECSYFEQLLQPLMCRFVEVGEEQQWQKSTLLVSQSLLSFIDHVPLRRLLLRRMFADIRSIVDVALIDSVAFVTVGSTNEKGKPNTVNFENFFKSPSIVVDADAAGGGAASSGMTSITYAGLLPGHQGKNLLSPICDPDMCMAWSRKNVEANVREAASADDVTVEVIMLSDSKQRQWAARTEAINRRRANRVGWRFTAYNHTLDTTRAVAWSKVVALQRHVERARRELAPQVAERHWLLWLDADAFIESDGAARIEALAWLAHGAQRDVVMPADPPIWQCQNLCTGVMLWRASAWTAQFLELWMRDAATRWGGTFLQSFSWEQRIINALWHERATRFYVAPYCVLNQACSAPPRSGAAVVHCMGAELHIRLARFALAEQDRFEPPPPPRRLAHASSSLASSNAGAGAVVVVIVGSDDADSVPAAQRSRHELRVIDRRTTFDDAVRALREARVAIALDGDAPLVAALVRLLADQRHRDPSASLAARVVVVDVQPTSTLSLSCRRVSQQARANGIDYHRKMAPFDWNSLAKIL
jgi:hypothetical protein